MYILVAPFKNSFDEIGLWYSVPEALWEAKVGQVVEINIQTKKDLAVIIEISDQRENTEKIKPICQILSNGFIFLTKEHIQILRWLPDFYFCKIHQAVSLFFPKNVKEKIAKNTFLKQQEKQEENIFSYEYNNRAIFSEAQQKAYNEIFSSHKNSQKITLLYGITGSGKTELYIKRIKETLDRWEQSLFLIPEIILWDQIGKRIQRVFWENVVILNSSVSDAKKTKHWIDIHSWKAKIIVGTRSALFYPYKNLSTIIMDEQHDQSYNSDKDPKYRVEEILNFLTEQQHIHILLGSGTPKISSMYQALKKKYTLVNLVEKFRR